MSIHVSVAIIVLALVLAPVAVAQAPRLSVSTVNPHRVVDQNGKPFFLMGDTAWVLPWTLSQPDVDHYLQTRKAQKFNTIHLMAFPYAPDQQSLIGYEPFVQVGGKPDPTQPIVNPGAANDYWDNLGMVIDKADALGLTVMLVPTWGEWVAGSWNGNDTSSVIFNQAKAYTYGQFIGQRFADKENILWSMGGDRHAVYGSKDYQPVWHALAEGVADGVNGVNNRDGQADYTTTLMTYHPRKTDAGSNDAVGHNSDRWFHNAPWLDINSNQDYPHHQVRYITSAYNKQPAKPVWLSEGSYETVTSAYTAYSMRVQAYQSVLAGGIGHTYGHARIWDLEPTWKTDLLAEGALDMQHLVTVMTEVLTDAAYLGAVPDQGLISGSVGSTTRNSSDPFKLTSNLIIAMRGAEGEFAMVYSANGRDIVLNLDQLMDGQMQAFWFNPRTGGWYTDADQTQMIPFGTFATGLGAGVQTFNPPGAVGDNNDWLLLLAHPSAIPEPSALGLLGGAGLLTLRHPRQNLRQR